MFDKLITYLMTLGNIRETDKGVSIMRPNEFDEAILAKLVSDAKLEYIYNPRKEEFNPTTRTMVETEVERLFVGKISGGLDAKQTSNHLANLK